MLALSTSLASLAFTRRRAMARASLAGDCFAAATSSERIRSVNAAPPSSLSHAAPRMRTVPAEVEVGSGGVSSTTLAAVPVAPMS